MIDLIFSGVKAAYEEYKNLMEFGEKLGAYQEEGEDLAERIDCVMPVVFRLEGNLADDMLPALTVMKKTLKRAKDWTQKMMEYVAANSGTNAKVVYGYLAQKLNGMKVAKGYSKQVDSMLEMLGPDKPDEQFQKLASKFESAVNILNLTVGTQQLTESELAKQARLAGDNKTTQSATPPAAVVPPVQSVVEQPKGTNVDTSPALAPATATDEASNGFELFVGDVVESLRRMSNFDMTQPAAADNRSQPADAPTDETDSVRVEPLTGDIQKATMSEIENMALDLMEDMTDPDVPDIFPLRVNRSAVFPSSFILSYKGQRWLIYTFCDRSMYSAPWAMTTSTPEVIESIQNTKGLRSAFCQLVNADDVVHHILLCGCRWSGGAAKCCLTFCCPWICANFANNFTCACVRTRGFTIPLKTQGVDEFKIKIIYEFKPECNSTCCLGFWCAGQCGNQTYGFEMDGKRIEY